MTDPKSEGFKQRRMFVTHVITVYLLTRAPQERAAIRKELVLGKREFQDP